MLLQKELENIHCSGLMAKIDCGIGRTKMSHRSWLSSQGPLWMLAQGQLLQCPRALQRLAGPQALFSQEGVCGRLGTDTQQSTSSHLLYLYIIVYLAVIAYDRDQTHR